MRQQQKKSEKTSNKFSRKKKRQAQKETNQTFTSATTRYSVHETQTENHKNARNKTVISHHSKTTEQHIKYPKKDTSQKITTSPPQPYPKESGPNCLLKIQDWLFLGVIILITFCVYSNTFNVPFYLDDERLLTDPDIQIQTLSIPALKKAAFDNWYPNRPVPNLTFALNYYFHKLRIRGYHLVNLSIHIMTALSLYCFLKLTLRLAYQDNERRLHDNSLPFLAALIWSIHPLQIQSVTYLLQRMNSMAALFMLLALICYVLGRQAKGKTKGYVLFLASCTCGFIAVACKEQAVLLPFLIILYEWYFFQDMEVVWLKRFIIPLSLIFIIPFVAFLAMSKGNPMQLLAGEYARYDFNTLERLMTEFRVVVFYLSLLFFPHPSRLNLEHDFTISTSLINPITTVFSLVLIIGMLGVAIYTAKRERLVSFAILWFFINHVIESTIIPLELVYEHRNYIPSMFVLLLFVLAGYRFIRVPYVKYLIPLVFIVPFTVWTYQRNEVWTDKVVFFEDSVRKSPNMWRAWDSLGLSYFNAWQDDKAIGAYKKSIEIRDSVWWTHQNLASALNRQGEHVEAMKHLRIAKNLLNRETSRELQGQKNKIITMIQSTQNMMNRPPRS